MRYHVRKGDTVESVAENFGVSAKMLRGWNHLKGSSLAGRKVLYLHLPVAPGSAAETPGSQQSVPAETQLPEPGPAPASSRQSTIASAAVQRNVQTASFRAQPSMPP